MSADSTYSSTGDNILETLDKAHRFTDWMYQQVKPWLRGSILEIGSGTGTYSKKLVTDFPTNTITLTDIDPQYVSKLDGLYKNTHVQARILNLEKKGDFEALGTKIDSAFALNVLEHVEQDTLALKHIHDHLNPGGVFVMLVPAHMFLYNRIDTGVDHFRRYSKKELLSKAKDAGFAVEQIYYFNSLAIPGWFINGTILKKDTLDNTLVGLYDKTVPIMRLVEKYIFRKKIGISLVAILRKRQP